MTIGEQIKKYRKKAGLSQRELGEKLGVSQQHIAQYENGKRIPKIETINSIAGALGIGIRHLYPDFSMEEWKQTDTYRKSHEKYESAIQSIITLLSYKYEEIETEVINNNTYYTIIIDGIRYELDYNILTKLFEFSIEMIPLLFDIIRSSVPLTPDDRK